MNISDLPRTAHASCPVGHDTDVHDFASVAQVPEPDTQAFASLGLGTTAREKPSPFSKMPPEIKAEILQHIPHLQLRDLAAVNLQFRDTVKGDPGLKDVYGPMLAAERTIRQFQEKKSPLSIDEVFAKSMAAQKAVLQLISDDALNPKSPVFDLALLNLLLHAEYIPKSKPTDIFKETDIFKDKTLPITSSYIESIVQKVLDGDKDDLIRARNLHALWLRRRSLSAEQRDAVSAANIEANSYSIPPWWELHFAAADESSLSSETRESKQTNWLSEVVLKISDERYRSYAIRVVDPRFLVPAVRAGLGEDARAMTKYKDATLEHLGLARNQE